MPALPSKEELEYVSGQIAARALERAAEAPVMIMPLVQAWFPNHDQIDLRNIVEDMVRGLEAHRALVLQRVDRLVASGKARCPGGQLAHNP